MTKFFLHFLIILVVTLPKVYSQTVTFLKDINPGEEGSYLPGVDNVLAYNGILYFSANEPTYGGELYRYDGTDVTLFKDINPGVANSNCENFQILNGKMLFTANDGKNGIEWWSTDGSEAGTKLIKDVNPGGGRGVFFSDLQSFYNDGQYIYFAGGVSNNYELWRTDGTSEGTTLVKNIAPDQIFVDPSYPEYFVRFKGSIYFNTRKGLYLTDGTEAGTLLVSSSSGFKELFNFDDKYILMLKDKDLWRSDGTSAGTVRVKTLGQVSRNWTGNRFSKIGTQVLFPGADAATGEELWKTDGTEENTQMVIDMLAGSNGYAPQNTAILNGKLYYKGESSSTGLELFTSDGTAGGTTLVKDFTPGAQGGFSLPTVIISDGQLLYMNSGPAFAKHLWYSDGTTAGTKEVKLNPTKNPFPFNFYKYENKLFLYAEGAGQGNEPCIVTFENQIVDADKDGFGSDVDCDDHNPNINPGVVELCDGIDNNCNNAVDEGLPQFTYYEDKDNDGYGNPLIPYTGCQSSAPNGFVSKNTDCNDNNASINPGAIDIANNGIDEDCNGSDFISSVYDYTSSKIRLTPNPASSTVIISSEICVIERISVYSTSGILLKSFPFTVDMDISNLPEGLYVLEINLKEMTYPVYKKLMIHR